MEAMLGISVYSFPYLKLGKTLCLSYHCSCLLFNQIGEVSRIGSAWKQGEWGGEGRSRGCGGEMGQTMYAHVNK
jgi:hypothetical protein